jgi:hypothetical protein
MDDGRDHIKKAREGNVLSKKIVDSMFENWQT